MQIKVAFGYDLEERFSIKIDVFILLIGLIVDIWICETEWLNAYPLEMMRPLH